MRERAKMTHVYFFAHRNLLSTRTRRSSIFRQPPTWSVNPATIPAALCALGIGIFFSYVGILYVVLSPLVLAKANNHRVFLPSLLSHHNAFQTSDIPVRFFFIPLGFALALVL